MSENKIAAMVILVVLVVIAVTVIVTWKLGERDKYHRQWDPHCTCSQQTCFSPPDGGWRQ